MISPASVDVRLREFATLLFDLAIP
jgi:hypothetical protein